MGRRLGFVRPTAAIATCRALRKKGWSRANPASCARFNRPSRPRTGHLVKAADLLDHRRRDGRGGGGGPQFLTGKVQVTAGGMLYHPMKQQTACAGLMARVGGFLFIRLPNARCPD